MRKPGDEASLLDRVELRLPAIYLAIGLVVTGLLCVLVAPFYAPDEPNQSLRAITLGHGALIERKGPEDPGGSADLNAQHVMAGMDAIRMAWEKRFPDWLDRPAGAVPETAQAAQTDVRWAGRGEFIGFGNTAVYPPFLYVPAVAGWRVGEAANLTIFWSLRLARLLCALTAVLLGWLALRMCAYPRWLLLPLVLLPSVLFLNASCSQDAVLLSVAALIFAMLSRPLVEGRDFSRRELAVTAGLIALCALARMPYLVLGLLLFLPGAELPRRWETAKQRWIPPTVAFVAIAAACALWQRLIAPLGFESAAWADPAKQLLFLRTHPVDGAMAVVNGTVSAAYDLAHRGLYVIGWNDLVPHHGVAAWLTASLAGIALACPPCPLRRWPSRALLALAVTGPLLGISLAEYIIWTYPGMDFVGGIQPRYWEPILPLAFLLVSGMVPRRLARTIDPVRTPLLLTSAGVLAIAACSLPWMAAHGLYRDSIAHVLLLNLR